MHSALRTRSTLFALTFGFALPAVGCDSQDQSKTKADAPGTVTPPTPGGADKAGTPESAKAAPAPHGAGAGGLPSGHPPITAKAAGDPRDITPTGNTTPQSLPGLAYATPIEWESKPPASPMRKAQFILPGPGGDAELLVFRFAGGGGTVDANIKRWESQFQASDGQPAKAKRTELTANGLKITLADIAGRHVAGMDPTGRTTTPNRGDQRMLAAIVEVGNAPYFFKTVGPAKTLDLWAEAFTTMATGMKPGSGDAAGAVAQAANKPEAKTAAGPKPSAHGAPHGGPHGVGHPPAKAKTAAPAGH